MGKLKFSIAIVGTMKHIVWRNKQTIGYIDWYNRFTIVPKLDCCGQEDDNNWLSLDELKEIVSFLENQQG